MKLTVFILTLLAALPAQAKDADYIFILGAQGNPYWITMAQGIEETARENKVSAAIHNLSNETAAEEQLNLCQTLAAKKPKLLVIEAVNISIGIQCFKVAHRSGVPFAFIDSSSLPDNTLPAAFTIGSDNLEIGKEAAKYASGLVSKGDKIAILEGEPGHVNAIKRLKGFREAFVKLSPDSSIVASVTAQWDRLKANSITTDLLTRTPDLKLIYAANDMMGLGAAEAVRSAGKEGQVIIIAVDGTKDAREAILAGRMQATVAQLPYLMGKRAVEMAIETRTNKKTGISETTPTPVLDKKILDAHTDPLLQYVR